MVQTYSIHFSRINTRQCPLKVPHLKASTIWVFFISFVDFQGGGEFKLNGKLTRELTVRGLTN